MMPALPSLSIVVPAYRSAASLPHLAAALGEILPTIASSYELIIVDDCGGDGTWEVIRDLAVRYTWVRGFALARNSGQHNALLCGILTARHDLIVTMDDDLQHPPALIGCLLASLNDDIDVVYGYPLAERHGLWRDFASRLTKRALALASGNRDVHRTSALRLFRGRLREGFARYRATAVSIDVLLSWETGRMAYVPVQFAPRPYGTSTYTVPKLMAHALNMITGFTVWPLRLASWFGFLFMLLGFAVALFALVNWLLRGSAVPGFAFLASTIAVFAGVQLFCLGLIGEYLARMYHRTLDRPPYTVRESVP